MAPMCDAPTADHSFELHTGLMQEQKSIELAPMSQLTEARLPNDDWTGTTSKGERRKRQNRLNQRAFRRRQANRAEPYPSARESQDIYNIAHHSLAQQPNLTTELWFPQPLAVIDLPYYSSSQSRSTSPEGLLPNCFHLPRGEASQSFERSSPLDFVGDVFGHECLIPIPTTEEPKAIQDEEMFISVHVRIHRAFAKNLFPRSADNLLTLIHFNVYRALICNVEVLQLSTNYLCERPSTTKIALGVFVPGSLMPTLLQTTVPHPRWIDIIPYPGVRDTLIRNIGYFDEVDFCNDLVGEVFSHPDLAYDSLTDDVKHCIRKKRLQEKQERGSFTANRRGLIVWDEPWDSRSWEVTPGFLLKWGWVVKGCEEIFRSTNQWRASRNEELLRVDEME